jgi:hypothetical protein
MVTTSHNHLDSRLAYLAGLFEGEGFISLVRRPGSRGRDGFSLVVGLNMTDREPLELFADTWGGRVGCYTGKRKHRPLFLWRLTSRKAVAFLEDVRPFLVSDRIICKADVAIAFQHQKRRGGHGPDGDGYYAQQVQFARGMRLLNRRGLETLTAEERAVVVAPLLNGGVSHDV